LGRSNGADIPQTQEKYYNFLLELHASIISTLKDNAVCKDVYAKALAQVKSKFPELEKHFVKNVGYGIGIETRDTTLLLNSKNTRVLKEGMMLVVSVGFAELENPKAEDKRGKIYSLLLTDTVKVGGRESDAVILTGGAPKVKDEVAFYFKDEGAAEPKAKEKKPAPKATAVSKNTAVLKTKLRGKREEVCYSMSKSIE